MADPYGYDRPTLVDLTDNVNTFRRKVNQISDDLGDKRRLLTDPGTSLASDSDVVGNLIELDYRINQTNDDLYLRANGGSLYIQNGNTSTIAAEFLYDSVAGTLNLISPMSGNFTLDVVGDIILDADGNDIIFKNGAGGDQVTHTLADDANYTITAPNNYTVDAVTDITLDADGNDIIFKNGAGGDQVTHSLADDANYTITSPANYTVDTVGDIILDAAGDNIIFKDDGNTRITYTLGATTDITLAGSLTTNVGGSILDSAATSITHVSGTTTTHTVGTNYNLTAGGNSVVNITGSIDEDAGTTIDRTAGTNITDTATAGSYTLNTGTTLEQTAGSSITQTSTTTFNQVSGGNFTTTVTGNVLVDASGDITLDADGNDIIFKNGAGGDTVTHTLADDANYTVTAPNNVVIDAVGNITLDADANNIVFRDGSQPRVQYTLGTDNLEYWSGNLVRDVSGSLKDSAETSITNVSGTSTTHTVGTNYTLTAGGNYTVDVDGSMKDSAGTSYTLVAGTTIDQVSGGNFTTTVGGDYVVDVTGTITLDADGNVIYFKDGAQTRVQYNLGANNSENWFGNFTRNVSGALVDSAGTSLETVSTTTTTHTVGSDYALTAGGNYAVDVDGSISDSAGTFISRTAGTNISDVAYTGSYTLDAATSIKDSAGTTYTVVAGTNISQTSTTGSTTHVSGTTTTHTVGSDYALTAGGNYTVDVDGSIADSANSISRVSTTTTTDTVGTDYTLTVGGTSSISSVGDYTLDVEGDIILDAADSDIFFKRAGVTFMRYHMGSTAFGNAFTTEIEVPQGNLFANVTGNIYLDADAGRVVHQDAGVVQFDFIAGTNKEIDVPSGNLTLDVAGDIILDAADSDIYFRRNGVDFIRYRMGVGASPDTTEVEVPRGNLVFDVTGDINLDADDGNVRIQDNAVTQFDFIAGTNKEIDIPSGNLTLDVAGDIIFDAGDSDIYFQRAGTNFMHFGMGSLGNVNTLEIDVPQGSLYFDVTGDISLDADGGNVAFWDGGVQQFNFIAGTNKEIYVPSGNLTLNVTGDINLDADGGNVVILDGGVEDYRFATDGTVSRTGDLVLDITGDIILDAGDSDIFFKRAGTTYLQFQMNDNGQGGTQVDVPQGYLYFDVAGDITLDADGNDIVFADGTTQRVVYNLGGNNSESWTGNLTRNISGALVDSAGASIYQVAGTTFNQVSGGNFTTTVTGDVLVDASGDITLDAAGQQINFVDATNTRMVFNLDATPQIDVTGNYTVSGSGSILQSSTTTQELTGTDITLDASNNIYLEADGDQIHLRAITANKFIFGVGTSPTLDITGNYTETGSGFLYTKSGTYLKDSAATTYTLTANNAITRTSVNSSITDLAKTNISQTATTGSYSQSSGTTFTQTSGGAFTQTSGGNFTNNVTGNILVDATGFYDLGTAGTIKDSAGTAHTTVAGTQIVRTSGTSTTDNVGTSYTLDADSAISQTAGWEFTQTSGTTFDQVSGGNFTTTVTGDFTVDASGIIVLDTESDTITFKDGSAGHSVTHVFNPVNGDYTVSAPSNYTLDVVGDITLDADGGDIFFEDAGTTNYQFATNGTISRTGDLALDVTGVITLDAAADNIVFADAGSTRITYTLGTTTDMALTGSLTHTIGGGYTENVTGSTERNANAILDSSDTTYTVVAKTSVSQTSGTTFEQVSGGTFTQTSGGNFTTNVTGDVLIDASGDITLDADGNDILFKNGGGADTVAHNLSDAGFYTITQSGTGNYTVDVGGDIILDADGNDIIFKNGAGADTVTHTLADDANYTITAPGNYTVDAVGDIFLDADGGLIRLYDGGTEFGRFTNTSGNLVVYSPQDNADIIFNGKDGGNIFTALTLDMSDSGSAIFNHNIFLPDNGRAVFGGGGDLQIHHNGTDAVIENFTNDLYISNFADDKDVIIRTDDGSGGLTQYIRADGSTTATILYFGGNEKLSTTATGIDVTGELVVDSASINGPLTITSASDGLFISRAGDGTYVTSLLQSVSDYGFKVNPETTGSSTSLNIHKRPTSAIGFQNSNSAGTTAYAIDLNPFGGDVRIGDSATGVIWDASTSRLGLGTTSPNGLLETKSTGDNFTYLRSGDANTVGIIFGNQSDAATASIQMLHSDNSLSIRGYNNTERARIDASGNFLVGQSTSTAPASGNVIGAAISPLGYISTNRTTVSAEFGTQTDGDIAVFRKDGAQVGSIGVVSTDNLYIQGNASHAGLVFGTASLTPFKNGAYGDTNIDLGGTSTRFKDFYYSGRISSGGVSATGSNGIWIDSATGNVGIGASSPDTKIHIDQTSQGNFTEAMRISNTGGGPDEGNYIQFEVSNTSGYGSRIGGRREGSGGIGLHFYTGAINSAPLERMRIDGSGRLLIGDSSSVADANADDVQIGNTTGTHGITILSDRSSVGTIYFADNDDNDAGIINYDHSGNNLRFYTNATEAVRIDQNRNLLVGGKTAASISTVGDELRASGEAVFTTDGSNTLYLNRKTSDGNIASFYKDGGTVGSIGITDSDLTIYSTTSNHTGLRFGTNQILPVGNNGSLTNGSASLGDTNYKFKDLWISGTANLPLVDIDGGSIVGCSEVGSAASPISAGEFNTLTVNTNLSVPGTISPSGIVFNDASALSGGRYDQSMTFGNDSDLAIYHDGSHSYITDKGTGDLRLRGSGIRIQGNDAGNLLIANEGAEVSLLYNNVQKLVTTSTGVTVTGLLTADTKSFTIDHPTKEGMKLRYGSLEGPEHGVYVRGRLNGENTIELPEVWLGLVDEDTITVNLTPIGKGECWVEDIQNNTITVGGHLNCFYMVLAERKDVEKLEVEFPSDGS